MINIDEITCRVERQLVDFERDVEDILKNTQLVESLINKKFVQVKEHVSLLNNTRDLNEISEIFDLLHDIQCHIDQVTSALEYELFGENRVSIDNLAEKFPNEGFFV